MAESTDKNGRQFGVGDILMYVGGGMSLLFLLLPFVWYTDAAGFDWLAVSLLLLLVLNAGVVVAAVLSLFKESLLFVPPGWFGFIFLMLIANMQVVQLQKTQFLYVLGCLLMAGGAMMAQMRICELGGRTKAKVAHDNAEAQLAKLKDMLDKGLINEDEYNEKRKAVLEKM